MKAILKSARLSIRNVRLRFKKRFQGKNVSDAPSPVDYWDSAFYGDIQHDRDTIFPGLSWLTSAYHYASTELCLIRCLHMHNVRSPKRILDIGSGSGHWTEFFLRTFPSVDKITACDTSEKSVSFLKKRFAAEPRVSVHRAKAHEFPVGEYDLACIIGCAFHITDDNDLSACLSRIAQCMPRGAVVCNDLLPLITHANQFHNGRVTKLVRSRHRWRRLAKRNGLSAFFKRNYAWLFAPGPIPEGHFVVLRPKR